jgi:uncharacterized phage infection (PIP) family protein YhgE
MTMADLTYKQLLKQVTDLATSVTKGAESVRTAARRIDMDAQDTRRVAEMISLMGVDPATTSETTELARIMQGVSKASIAYASAGDTTAKQAQASAAQARTTHSGIQEAVDRSPVDRIHDVHHDWFRQQ